MKKNREMESIEAAAFRRLIDHLQKILKYKILI